MTTERKGARRRQAFSARSLVAGVVALLIVLQGLAAIGSSFARSVYGGGEASFVASLLGPNCAVDAHSGDKSPAQERGHSQCCVLCGVRDFDGAALPGVAQISEAIAPLQAPVSIERHFADSPTESPIGWASSWSSQAPPYFS